MYLLLPAHFRIFKSFLNDPDPLRATFYTLLTASDGRMDGVKDILQRVKLVEKKCFVIATAMYLLGFCVKI